MIDTDEQLKTLNTRLQKIVEGINAMKEAGINEDLLIAYMCYNLHMSKKEVLKILTCHEEFYDKLVKRMTIKKLKE